MKRIYFSILTLINIFRFSYEILGPDPALNYWNLIGDKIGKGIDDVSFNVEKIDSDLE